MITVILVPRAYMRSTPRSPRPVLPSIFLGALSLPFEGLRALSLSKRLNLSNRDPEPSTHRQAQGQGEVLEP